MTKDKSFYHTFFSMFFMLVLQNMISLGVNLADNIMLGRFSEAALSGVTAVNQIQFVYQQLLMGIGDGLVILSAQYWGKNDTASMKKVSAVAMHLTLWVIFVLFLLVSLFPGEMVGLFTKDTVIIQEGVSYLKIVRFTYLFFGITNILLATLRSTEVVGIAFVLSLTTLVINCSLNWVFIYGHLGMPRMGAAGAAVGTLTARCAELLLVLLFLWKKEKNLHLHLKDYLGTDAWIRKDYYRVCAPIICGQCLWGVNTAMQTAILGHLSSSAIAANSMASNLFLMVKTAAVGAASTANVMIGKTIGLGVMKKVKEYARTFQILFLGIGVISGAALFVLIDPVLSLYTFSPESERLARSFLQILCIVMVGMSYQMPVNAGIIKGGGSTKYAMAVDVTSTWAIVMPLSFTMAFVVKASPAVVVWCLNIDQLFKCVPAFLKVNFGHWVKKLTR